MAGQRRSSSTTISCSRRLRYERATARPPEPADSLRVGTQTPMCKTVRDSVADDSRTEPPRMVLEPGISGNFGGLDPPTPRTDPPFPSGVRALGEAATLRRTHRIRALSNAPSDRRQPDEARADHHRRFSAPPRPAGAVAVLRRPADGLGTGTGSPGHRPGRRYTRRTVAASLRFVHGVGSVQFISSRAVSVRSILSSMWRSM